MKLTVVTTTYNQEKFIGKAIDGMLSQKTNFPFQIVVSNDCSTDNTLSILEEYQKKYPEKIRIINNKKNLGAMGNFIATLNEIKDSEYVALCDGDDFWTDENKLQEQVDFLDNNKDFNICFHKARLFYEDGSKEEQIIPANAKEISNISDLVNENYIVANSVVYRWRFNDKSLKEIFPEDIVPGDYYVHLLHAQNGKIKMIDKVMSSYRRHDKGMWWSNDSLDKCEFTLKYGKKFLNFYNAADSFMKLPDGAFYAQRKDIVYNILVSYVKKDKFEDLKSVFESDKDIEIARLCQKEIVDRNLWYIDYLASNGFERERELRAKVERYENSRLWKIRSFLRKMLFFIK